MSAAIFKHIVQGALSPPHTARMLGWATQGHTRVRILRALLRTGGNFSQPILGGVPGMQRAQKAKTPAS